MEFVDQRGLREPIFGNLDRFFSLVARGIAFAWAPLEKGGSVTATFEGPDTPEAALHVLRGSLQFVFEASGTTGTAERRRWRRSRRSARWSAISSAGPNSQKSDLAWFLAS
jgi:hypothetical protein